MNISVESAGQGFWKIQQHSSSLSRVVLWCRRRVINFEWWMHDFRWIWWGIDLKTGRGLWCAKCSTDFFDCHVFVVVYKVTSKPKYLSSIPFKITYRIQTSLYVIAVKSCNGQKSFMAETAVETSKTQQIASSSHRSFFPRGAVSERSLLVLRDTWALARSGSVNKTCSSATVIYEVC